MNEYERMNDDYDRMMALDDTVGKWLGRVLAVIFFAAGVYLIWGMV